MNSQLFQTFIATLSPQALAHVIIDLEESLEDWNHYPEDGPSAEIRDALAQTLNQLIKLGEEKANAANLDFQAFLEQLRDELHAQDWSSKRDSQERDNWLKDYE